MIFLHSSPDNPVYCFIDKKRPEGEHFYVYTTAGAAKLLRIYYARMKKYLSAGQERTAS